ncbi:MAG: 4a-hydroxytetrahydrobiopterin dehydratase, partial [Methylococcales bacterium]|nr:4a-hydroxytetrahydrobiopterin dehydratase [Methylococcales bacterium]
MSWREKNDDSVFSDEAINARLTEELPAWRFEKGWIRR